MVLSVKKQKIKMLERLLKEDLEKIAEIEHISKKGSKQELINRLSGRLNLQRTRNYVKKLVLHQVFNIFDHELVPKHRVLTQEEKKKLLERYKVTARQLPRITMRDPAILTIGAKPGDIIEITRKSPIAGKIKYYRIVMKPKR